jgi:hypothetical protein
MKVTTTDEFDGAQDKADSFLEQLTLCFWARIVFALLYMKGKMARSWVDQVTKGILDGQNLYANFPMFQAESKKCTSVIQMLQQLPAASLSLCTKADTQWTEF